MKVSVCPKVGSDARVLSVVFLFLALVHYPARCDAQASYSIEPKPGVGRTVRVPFEYEHPELGSFELYYELGKAFDPAKRTVFIVGDGQQYYVRKDLIEPLQEEIFGERFNVVGLVGRGSNEAAVQHVKHGESIDWLTAYGVFKSSEWVEDIESVRFRQGLLLWAVGRRDPGASVSRGTPRPCSRGVYTSFLQPIPRRRVWTFLRYVLG
jgi:hypothetical protein